MEALSDIAICGSDFRLTNLRNANRNVSVDRFVTTSKCTARVVAQVNKHMCTFSSPLLCRTYNAPVKSTPVTVKEVMSRVLTSESGAGSGAGNGLPQCLLQTTQWRSNALVYCRVVGIQYVWWIAVKVLFVLAWKSLAWILWITSDVNWCFGGSRYGNLASWLIGALWILPPQRINPVRTNAVVWPVASVYSWKKRTAGWQFPSHTLVADNPLSSAFWLDTQFSGCQGSKLFVARQFQIIDESVHIGCNTNEFIKGAIIWQINNAV